MHARQPANLGYDLPVRWLPLALFLGGCAMDLGKARTIRAEATDRNEAAFETALAQAGFTAVDLPGGMVVLDEDHGSELASVDEDEDEDEAPSEPREMVIVGRWSEASPSSMPDSPQFAHDAEGKLWLVERRPQASSTRTLKVKGCAKGYDKGITPASYDVGFLLPPGVHLEGRTTVSYPVDLVFFRHAKGRCYKGPPRA